MKPFLLIALAALTSLHAVSTDKLASYDYGDSRLPLIEIQSAIWKADAAERATLERQFIALLERDDVPTGAKDVICRWLQVIGTPASIPALEKTARDPKIGFLAVYALMNFPDSEATAALLRLLEESSGGLRSEIIGALGRRGATEAVAKLAKINDPSSWIALAAIGSREAVSALQKMPASENIALDWARVYGAMKVLPRDKTQAVSVFQGLLSSPARIGALQGLIQADDPGALAALRQFLQEGNLQSASLAKPFASNLAPDFGNWNPEIQTAVLLAGNDLAMSRLGLASPEQSVRTAAIQALGRSEHPGVIEVLLPLLTSEKDADAASLGLQRIRQTDANAQLRAALQNSPAQAALLVILAQRQDREILGAAFAATQSDDEKLRTSGFQALALLAQPDDLPKFLALLPTIKSPTDQTSWNKTLFTVVQNSPDPDGAATLLEGSLGNASSEARASLLAALASLKSDKAKTILAAALQADDLEHRKTVIRTLSGVRTISSNELLLGATRNAKDSGERMLALRGYLDGLRSRTDLNPDQLFEAYQLALSLAVEPAEKDAILAGIKGIKKSSKAEQFLKKIPAGA